MRILKRRVGDQLPRFEVQQPHHDRGSGGHVQLVDLKDGVLGVRCLGQRRYRTVGHVRTAGIVRNRTRSAYRGRHQMTGCGLTVGAGHDNDPAPGRQTPQGLPVQDKRYPATDDRSSAEPQPA